MSSDTVFFVEHVCRAVKETKTQEESFFEKSTLRYPILFDYKNVALSVVSAENIAALPSTKF